MPECDCIRCRKERYEIDRRSSIDVFVWSIGLFKRYPSVPILFGSIAAVELVQLLPGSVELSGSGVFFAGLLLGRGYTDLCVRDDLLNEKRGRKERFKTVIKKLPTAVIAYGLSRILIIIMIAAVAFPALRVFDRYVESFVLFIILGVPVALTIGFVGLFVYSKFFLVHEACFIDNEGILGSLRKSWGAVRLRRVKVVVLAGLFGLVVGSVFFSSEGDGSLGVLRVGTTAVYSAVLSHVYIKRSIE